MDTGFLLVNKPKGISSFKVVAQLRKITQIKKIGHAGTLDPMAEGLLICAIGREATKKINQLILADKKYTAEITLGSESTTYDAEGELTKIAFDKTPTEEEIKNVLKNFEGELSQLPPIFSAKKINGQPAYKLARQAKEVILQPSIINVHSIEFIHYNYPTLEVSVHCSKGTYIRSLAHDIGKELKTGGYLTKLIRTKIGDYSLENSKKVEELNSENWHQFLFQL